MIDRNQQALSRPVPALFLAAGMLSGCMTGGDGSIEGLSSASLKREQGTYRIEGGNIINENRIRHNAYCSLGQVVTRTDTLKNDTIPFELAGNTLILFNPHLDTMESGALVQQVIQTMRMGRGSSLTGLWQYTEQSYRVLAGALSEEERAEAEEEKTEANSHWDITTFQVQFSGGAITTFEDTKTAEAFLSDWNEGDPDNQYAADSARYDIAVKVVGKYQVELKGRLTGETVLLTLENDRSETFQSSDPAHASHRYDRIPKSCPNEPEPLWYREFLDANYKTGSGFEKRGAPDAILGETVEKTSKKQSSFRIPFVPLKSIRSLLN
jgi:hypothetical protein